LKKLNDAQGHMAGDRALAEIGRCLRKISSRSTIPYRVGGDEFVVLFVHESMTGAEAALAQLRANVSRAGYSVSIGCVKKENSQSMEDALLESDIQMYNEKTAYYRNSGIERRGRTVR
jgi:diguanylate cyclase (GGDEF)-like protein